MRVQSAVLAGLLCLFAFAASGAITSISPTTIPFAGGQEPMTIVGTDLLGTQFTTVLFDGIYEVEPSAASSARLTVLVPIDVSATLGSHTLEVLSYDLAGTRVHGPVSFTVAPGGGTGPPLLAIPESIVATADGPTGAKVTYEASAISANGDPVAASCSPASGTLFPLGITTVSCSATDAGGTANGSFTVFVTDFTPPVLTVPADIETANPVVTFTATATDNLDATVSVTCSPASGSTFPNGTTTVLCTAIDSHANYTFGTFKVRVTGGPPLLLVPADIFAEATSAAGAVVAYTVTAEEASSHSCSPASGSTFPLGTTTVNCSATNAAGTATATFKVIVEDHTAPVLTLPSVVEAEATSPAGATVTFTVSANDAVDGARTVDCTPASGTFFSFGTTEVFCTSVDTRGNVNTGSFDVVVQDTTAPTILVASATPDSLWPPNHKMVEVTLTVQATDAVDPTPSIHILSVSSNQPVNGTGDGDMAPDWAITGPLSLQLRAERAGGSERVYTVTVAATDLNGNTSTAAIPVRVVDSRRARSMR